MRQIDISLNRARHRRSWSAKNIWTRMHLDGYLLSGILLLLLFGLIVLYSASGSNWQIIEKQLVHITLALTVMVITAQIPPRSYVFWSPWFFAFGFVLLIAVLFLGDSGKGAQRWLDLGLIRFQPSEVLKLAVPLMVAYYLNNKILPPTKINVLIGASFIVAPAALVFMQPDLGTAILIASSGFIVFLLAGVRWRLVASMVGLVACSAIPIFYLLLHNYQRQRILTLFNPEADPRGSGYHIIQSKIAIGSGGIFGRGWLQSTQSHLEFLPEPQTDFIFAVLAEEMGMIGTIILMSLYFYIIARGLYIGYRAQDTFSRLVAGSITLTFFVYVFVNIAMVTGILPVVGVPLPLVSYGGTSLVTLMSGFGILMSVHTHRKLIST